METAIMENRTEAIAKFKALVEDVEICMLATTSDTGELLSRPMATASIDDEGNVWFFTNEFSEKIHDASHNNEVSLIYAHPGKNIYMHVNGLSTVVIDKNKIKELWKPFLKAWFPDGIEDPKLCLLKVSPQEAYYWNSSSNIMVTFFHIIKAVATQEKYGEGEAGKLKIGK